MQPSVFTWSGATLGIRWSKYLFTAFTKLRLVVLSCDMGSCSNQLGCGVASSADRAESRAHPLVQGPGSFRTVPGGAARPRPKDRRCEGL